MKLPAMSGIDFRHPMLYSFAGLLAKVLLFFLYITQSYAKLMFSKAPTSPYPSLADSEQITDRAKISHLLDKYTQRYTPLSALIPGHKETYTSCIVNVDSKHVLLDELLPKTGHELLVAEGAVLVTGKLDGVVVQFFTTLKRVDDNDKMLTYHMKLPTLLEYRQRRQNYRVRIPMTRKLPVSIENKNGKILKGRLHDLSHGGAGMLLLADKTIMEAGRPHKCSIELPGGDLINCTAELCFSKKTPSHYTKFIGVQFVGLSPLQSRLIGRSINELEREYIQKQ